MYLNNPEILYRLQIKKHEEMIISAENSRLIHEIPSPGRDRRSLLKQTVIWVGYHMMTWGYKLVKRFDLLPDETTPCASVIAR
jgi:hypothetical protein